MIVYGGYQFPGGNVTKAGNGSGSLMTSPQLLRYHLRLHTWEALMSEDDLIQPEPRYGHTSVVYNVRIWVGRRCISWRGGVWAGEEGDGSKEGLSTHSIPVLSTPPILPFHLFCPHLPSFHSTCSVHTSHPSIPPVLSTSVALKICTIFDTCT